MYKISKIVALVLGVLGVILWLLLVLFTDAKDVNNSPMSGMFYISYLLLAVSVLAVIVSGAQNILSSPKALKKTLIYTGSFVGIVVVSYLLSLGEPNTTETLVSTGLITFYILTAIATFLLVFSGVKNALTK